MSGEDERVSVQTYITATQRDRWREDAGELDMSLAEYLRTMVQAGRRGFDLTDDDGGSAGSTPVVEEGAFRDATPGVDGLKSRVHEVLLEAGVADWDELLAEVTGDVEERLDGALESLQSEGRVRYSGRDGGYTVVEDGR